MKPDSADTKHLRDLELDVARALGYIDAHGNQPGGMSKSKCAEVREILENALKRKGCEK